LSIFIRNNSSEASPKCFNGKISVGIIFGHKFIARGENGTFESQPWPTPLEKPISVFIFHMPLFCSWTHPETCSLILIAIDLMRILSASQMMSHARFRSCLRGKQTQKWLK